jgi:hypothetical protein
LGKKYTAFVEIVGSYFFKVDNAAFSGLASDAVFFAYSI